jgi:hypothetical protein
LRFCRAGLAQLVEQLICNQQVAGSSPITSSILFLVLLGRGQMPEWLKGADCKSAGFGLRRFESFSAHHFSSEKGEPEIEKQNGSLIGVKSRAGVAQLARVSAFQAEGCGFETRLPLQ